MIFKQHYLACLSHASYLIGDETTGRAVVVDPRRDVGEYCDDAATRGLRIERVIETHLHADFLSGHLELAARTDAVISYGAAARVDFDIEALRDGERLSLGEVTLEVLATPGHTPESICVVVYEHPDDDAPYGVLTGDTLFVGDVGRPDLLASSGAGLSADVLARSLYHSLHDKVLALPDPTRVFPAHGAGSSCGKQLSSETNSTIGEQRRTNYALQPMSEDDFVSAIVEGQPVRPHYFEFDALRNRQLRPLLDEDRPPALLDVDEVRDRQCAGAMLLDTREPTDFAAGHLRGAVNVGLQGRFAEWAGDLLDPQRDIVLVGDPTASLEGRVRLARIGFDRTVGQLADPGQVLTTHPELVETSSRLTIEQLAELRGLEPDLQLVDVRNPGETAAGTLPGAREISLAVLTDCLDSIDRTRPLVLYCASGYRSLIAASFLCQHGHSDVSDLFGGYGAWAAAELPAAGGAAVAPTETPEVAATSGAALVEAGAVLLDVREPEEWAAGHAPGAVLVPMGQVHDRVPTLPSRRAIVVICRSGGRSAAITQALRARSYDAVNLAGGMRAWAAAGLPVTTDAGTPGRVA
ncbi:MAG TPA: MBL fold metallo-hydrolase [Acidimicrobiia bacterium]|nr:MBL fold metallo-hydrolase [Acidimicrobiia bacterium]